MLRCNCLIFQVISVFIGKLDIFSRLFVRKNCILRTINNEVLSDIFKWNFPIYDYLCIWAINDIQVPTTREKSHINEDFTIKEVKCLQAFAFSKNEFSIFLQPGWKRNMQYTFTIFEVFISQYVDARTCSKLKCLEIFAVFICILNISTGKNEEVENRRLWISFPSNDFMLCINVS